MRRAIQNLAACTLLCSTFTFAAKKHVEPPPPPPPSIKVLLSEDTEGALVEVKGKKTVTNPKKQKQLSWGLFGKRYFLCPIQEGVKWGEAFLKTLQIRITPSAAETSILMN